MALVFSSLLTDIGVLLIILFWCAYRYWHRHFDYWKDRNIPFITPTLFFGNIKDLVFFRRNESYVFQDLYNELEGHKYGGILQLTNPTLLLRDPEIIKLVTVKDFSFFQDRGFHVDTNLNPLGQHLFVLGGWKWRVLRTKLTPTFTSGKMKMMFNIMEECASHLQEYLSTPASKGEILELKDVLAKFSTDVIGSCAFGLQMNALDNPDSEFRRMGKKVFQSTRIQALRFFMGLFLPKIASIFKFPVFEPEVTEFFTKVVKETVEFREKNNIERNDFLQLLIHLKTQGKLDDDNDKDTSKHESGKHTNEEEKHLEMDYALLTAQVFVFFLAGFETSSTTMSFVLHELAVNPEIQIKLREEIDRTLEENGGKFTYDSIMNMAYLDKVISETLRKYPPVGNLRREVTVPYMLKDANAKLDVGTSVVIPVYALHHDPKYFPNPERFDPERFSEEEKAKRPHYVYMPFGEGPRICIGMRFGLLQTKMGLAALLAKYEFHVCNRTEIPLTFDPKSTISASRTGTILQITKRSDNEA